MSENTTLRYSQLLNRLVIDVNSTEEVGHVDALLINVKTAQIAGIVCKSGLLGREKVTFAWAQVTNIGQDSLVVQRDNPSAAADHLATSQSMIGLEVWTDTGNKAGHITDYEFDRTTGKVDVYLFASEGLRDRPEGFYGLYPESILSAGRKRIMVTSGAVERAELYTDSVDQQASQTADFIKSDGDQPRQDWASWMKGAKSWADQVQQRTQSLKSYTQEHLPELTDQLQDTTRQVRKQVKKQVSEVQDRLHESNLSSPFKAQTSPGEAIDIQSFEVWEDDDENQGLSVPDGQTDPS